MADTFHVPAEHSHPSPEALDRTPYMMAVSVETYRGIPIYQTGEAVVILLGHHYHQFISVEQARSFIDAALKMIVSE